jgi:hypothetical protein
MSRASVGMVIDKMLMCVRGRTSKDPGGRPVSAAAVSERLAAAIPADGWTLGAAAAWWDRHRPLAHSRLTGARRALTASSQRSMFFGDHLLLRDGES